MISRIACVLLILATTSCGGGPDDFGDCAGTMDGVPIRYALTQGFSRYTVEPERNLAVVQLRFENEYGERFLVNRAAVDADVSTPIGPAPLYEGRPEWLRAWNVSGLDPVPTSGTFELLNLSEDVFVASFTVERPRGDDLSCLIEMHR